jgi:hypothetical protein
LEENIQDNKKKPTINIFATHGYFTNRTIWKHARYLPYTFLGFAGLQFLMAATYAYDVFFPSSILFRLSPEFYEDLSIRTVRFYPGHIALASDIIFCVFYMGLGLSFIILYKCLFTWSTFESSPE